MMMKIDKDGDAFFRDHSHDDHCMHASVCVRACTQDDTVETPVRACRRGRQPADSRSSSYPLADPGVQPPGR